MDHQRVADAIVHAAAQEITPRFRALADGDVTEKSPGEVVTTADRACELLLTDLLRSILAVPVIGEEASAADASLPSTIAAQPAAWVVDPLDGTANFAAGSADHSVMVAFVERGTTTASWIWTPEADSMAIAARGAGATVNGARVTAAPPSAANERAGVVKERFLPDDIRASINAAPQAFAHRSEGRNCAGIDYPDLVAGTVDVLLYWRTLPWDHLPGALFAREAGCRTLRPNGELYDADSPGEGLLVAHESVCDELRETLFSAAR